MAKAPKSTVEQLLERQAIHLESISNKLSVVVYAIVFYIVLSILGAVIIVTWRPPYPGIENLPLPPDTVESPDLPDLP